MAVLTLQSPTSPNTSKGHLVYTLYSQLSSLAKYRYLVDVYESGSGDYITTLKAYPNLEGTCNIDLARELDDQLEYDLAFNVRGAFPIYPPTGSVKTFDLRFGEEYALSYSGSLSSYPGIQSNYLKVFPGEWISNQGSYNFNFDAITDTSNILSNAPIAKGDYAEEDRLFVGNTDRHTITFYDPIAVYVELLNDSDQIIGGSYLFNLTGEFYSLGIGPLNLLDVIPLIQIQQAASIRVRAYDGGQTLYQLYLPQSSKYPCNTDHTRFAFINQYGFWDYYNVYNPLRRQTEVDRKSYTRSFVQYEQRVARYDSSNRKEIDYNIDYTDTYSIQTDYLSQATAEWLSEMFKSPQVYTVSEGVFTPIVLTNTSIERNMNQFRQKLFQYNIEFRYANERQSR
jgi:hypothetical protein